MRMNIDKLTLKLSGRTKRLLVNSALIAGSVGAAVWLLFGTQVGHSPAAPSSMSAEGSDTHATAHVHLPAEKLATAAIETQPASIRALTHTHTVPGRIEYDASRRLQLRLPAECVVKEVLVRPGQQVAKGDKLAVLTSQQFGLGRDAVQQCEENLQRAQHEQQWIDGIVANVEVLLTDLEQSPAMADIEATFKDRPLGQYRQELLSAYSDYLLAKQVREDSATLSDRGVLSGRTMIERRNQLERARAAFYSVCEETKHHVHVEKQTALTAVDRARRALKISTEQLAALVGSNGANAVAAGDSLNELVLTAPFAGRIEERHIMPAAVVAANSPLFTLANTDQLWVVAQIHERNWQAASAAPGQVVRVHTPAIVDHEFTAIIEFVGAVVDPETRALPLFARIENPDHLLKPGMFIWVYVPVEAAREVLSVPASAVMRHDGQAFVFVADAQDTFRRMDVTTGLETEEWIEVRDGLVGGENVAAKGAFALKSELLLEREES